MPTQRPRELKKHKEPKKELGTQLEFDFNRRFKEPDKRIALFLQYNQQHKITLEKVSKYCINELPTINLIAGTLQEIATSEYLLKYDRPSNKERDEYLDEIRRKSDLVQSKKTRLSKIGSKLLELLYNEKGEPTIFKKILDVEFTKRSNTELSREEAFVLALVNFEITLSQPSLTKKEYAIKKDLIAKGREFIACMEELN